MSGVIVCDIEADGLSPSVIWMIGVLDLDTDQYESYHGDRIVEGLMRLEEADMIVGHYFRGYDAKVIRELTQGLCVIEDDRIVDTCELSRSLFPELPNHKLSTWGKILGFPKGDYSDWSCYSPEMDAYCERDVRLCGRIFEFMMESGRL